MQTRPLTILYIKISLASVRLLSRVFQPSDSIIEVTLDVLWYLLVTYLAALLWIISMVLMLWSVYGSQTGEEYSSIGRTKVE